MKRYQKLRGAIDKANQVERWYCAALLVIMLVIAFCQVIRRYVFRAPWPWSDEVILFILAWFAYPAINLNVWNDNHFHIASVYNKFPPVLQKCADVFRHLLIGGYMAFFSYYSFQLIQQFMSKSLSVTGIPQGLKFVPVFFTSLVSLMFCVINLIGCFVPKDTARMAEGEDQDE